MAQTKVSLIQDNVIVAGHLHTNHGITTDHIGEGSTRQYFTTDRVQTFLTTNNYIKTTDVSNLESVTSLSLNANILSYVDEAGNTTNIDLSLYLDDSNLARIVSGSLDSGTGVATFTRDDASTFTVDFSAFLSDANDYVTSASFNTTSGVLTLTRLGGGTVTVDLDGKYSVIGHNHDDRYYTETESDARFQPIGSYLTSYTETSTLDSVADRGRSTNQQLISTNPSGFRVDSGSYARIELDSTDNWSYVRLQDQGVTTWDIACYNSGNLEWRPGGGETNRMTLSQSGYLTINGSMKVVGGVIDMNNNDGFVYDDGSNIMYVKLDGTNREIIHSANIGSQSVNYASSAGNADTVDGYHASSLWRSDGATWNPSANVILNQSANSQEWSFDIIRNGYSGGYWQVWDSSNSTMLKVDAVNGKVYAPYNFVGNLEGNASSASSVAWGNVSGKPSTFTPSSHNHDDRYYTESESNSRFTSRDHFRSTGTGYYTSTTTSALITEALGDGAFDSYLTAHKTGWSYAGNGNLTDAGRLTELAGSSWLWWTDNPADGVQGNITGLCIAPNTGGSANKVFIYNNQGSGYAPGWREVWTNKSDGSGSGLDADLLDGLQGSQFLRSDAEDTTNSRLNISVGSAQEGLVVTGEYPQLTLRRHSIGDASIHYDAGYAKKWNVGPGAGGAEEDEFGFAIYDGPRGTHYGTPMRINAETQNVMIGDADHPAFRLDVRGTIRSTADVRAPIFYDSDDTNSYFDKSRLILRSTDPTIIFRDTDHTSAMWHVNSHRMYLLRGNGDTTSWSTTNGHWPVYWDLGNNNAYFGGTILALNAVTAPIFYDRDNTSYYVNPASTSRINRIDYTELHNTSSNNNGRFLNHSSWGTLHQTDHGYIQIGPANTGHAHIYTDRSNFYFNRTIYVNGGSEINTGDIRSAIFYDKDNTAYYCNPATQSNLVAVTLSGTTNTGYINCYHSGTYGYAMNMEFAGSSSSGLAIKNNRGSTGDGIAFIYGNAPQPPRGNISISSTGVSYNSVSDYRAKENVTPLTGAIDRVSLLKPSRFNFIGDQETVDGFLAHEVQEVVPQAVNGEKDAVDQEGNDLYQSMDASKMVPLLTAALQEAIAKIESLESRIQVLENQ